MTTRRTALIVGASVALVVAAGCGDDDSTNGPETVEAPPTSVSDETTTLVPPEIPGGSGYVFRGPGEGTGDEDAFTYDEAAVPVGAVVNVDSAVENGRTTVTFSAQGLAPNRDFGVHVHTRPCGPQPSDSGPHYQNVVDPAATPEAPSSDPAYANPQNEVWLDVTTDASGHAQASTAVEWEFRDGEANSLVLHAQHTMTGPGQAGMAGARLACVDEEF
ncbi:superoxide dismutase family protein [Rhodococcus sp. NPDC003318]|uniref:superoxide dismutase family protein n=1 Tax=Rhodococcus sp. NPDC003318 TaxID=3364503 RepID=UPI003679A7CA